MVWLNVLLQLMIIQLFVSIAHVSDNENILRGLDLKGETGVLETEDPDGCPRDGGSRRKSPRWTTRADWHRRMFLRRKVKTVEPAVMAFLFRNIHA